MGNREGTENRLMIFENQGATWKIQCWNDPYIVLDSDDNIEKYIELNIQQILILYRKKIFRQVNKFTIQIFLLKISILYDIDEQQLLFKI